MGTDKGRYTRRNAERRAEREAARNCAPMVSGFYSAEIQSRWDRDATDRKYARLNERVSGKPYESHLSETRKLKGTEIRARVGKLHEQRWHYMGEVLEWLPDVPELVNVRKTDLNHPEPDELQRPKGKALPAYDPTNERSVRDNSSRPYLGDTSGKAKNAADTSVMRRAWREMDARTKEFVKLKSK